MKFLQVIALAMAVLVLGGNVASAGCPGGQCKVGVVKTARGKVKKLRAKGRKAARAVRLAVPWSMR